MFGDYPQSAVNIYRLIVDLKGCVARSHHESYRLAQSTDSMHMAHHIQAPKFLPAVICKHLPLSYREVLPHSGLLNRRHSQTVGYIEVP